MPGTRLRAVREAHRRQTSDRLKDRASNAGYGLEEHGKAEALSIEN